MSNQTASKYVKGTRNLVVPIIKQCNRCGDDFPDKRNRRKFCEKCKHLRGNKISDLVPNVTKSELFAVRKNWQSARSTIVKHAKKIYNNSDKPYACFVCSYDFYTEVCHIRDVQDFPSETLISVINDLDNLVRLCPNHHKEFDTGHLKL